MDIMVKPTDSFILCKISAPDKKELNMPQCVEKQSSLVRVRSRCVFLGDLGIEENPLVALSNMKKLTNSTLNQSSLFLALLNRGAANNPCYAPAVEFYLPLLNFILPLIENSLISRNFRYDWVVLFIRNPKMASDLLQLCRFGRNRPKKFF